MPYNEKINGTKSSQDTMPTNSGKTGIEKQTLVPKTDKSSRKTGKVK